MSALSSRDAANAEADLLRAAVGKWRAWAQFVWLGGGSVTLTDDELRLAVCERSEPPPEVCICAAVELADGRVIRGHRHDDCIQTALKWKQAGQDVDARAAVQGFVTSRGRFVDRAVAHDLQVAAGRLERTPSRILFSEDLY